MSDEWLAHVGEMLKDSLGSRDQKMVAYIAARDMAANLPGGSPKADRWAAELKRLFELWVHHMRYLRRVDAVDEHLPESVHRSDTAVSVEYGLRTSKGIGDKQEQLATYAASRMERCAAHLRAGWDLDMCVGFVASKEEWRQALRQAGRAAA